MRLAERVTDELLDDFATLLRGRILLDDCIRINIGVSPEEERLQTVLPLVRKYGAAVVAISNDETGISEDPDVRFEVLVV